MCVCVRVCSIYAVYNCKHTRALKREPKLKFCSLKHVTKRYYSFRIITYAKEEEFQTLLKYGTKWEYIFHDKDKKEDGTPKEPHWHINIILREWKTVKGVCKLIEGDQNSLAIPMNDKREAHEYLTHQNDPDKFQYDENLIKSSAKKLWKETESKTDENELFIKTIEDRTITLREKAIRLGKDYMKNYYKYESFLREMKQEEEDIERGYRTNIITISEFDFWEDYYENVEKPILKKIKDPIMKEMIKAKMWGQDPKQYIEKEQMKFDENGEIKN